MADLVDQLRQLAQERKAAAAFGRRFQVRRLTEAESKVIGKLDPSQQVYELLRVAVLEESGDRPAFADLTDEQFDELPSIALARISKVALKFNGYGDQDATDPKSSPATDDAEPFCTSVNGTG